MAASAREPDKDLSRWTVEFLLQQPTVPGPLLQRVISILNFSSAVDSDRRLKKSLHLKLIQSQISQGSVSENILDFLEVIEKLDREDGKLSISETMKTAYCAVALECTVMEGKKIEFEAVERVWRGRIQNLESDLVTDELKKFGDEVEAAVWDDNVCSRLLEWGQQNDAVHLVGAYLEEAKDEPSFLELAAARWKKPDTGAEQVHENAEEQVHENAHENAEEQVHENAEEQVHEKVHEKVHENAEEQVQEKVHENAEEQVHENAHEKVHENAEEQVHEDAEEQVHENAEQPISKSPAADRRKKGYDRVKRSACKLQKGRASKYDTLPSPEVKQLQNALRSCSLELQAAVNDPLPDALLVSESLVAESPQHVPNIEKPFEKRNEENAGVYNPPGGATMTEFHGKTSSPDIPTEKGNRNEVEEPEPSTNQDHESSKAAGTSSKPSLMTRNSTACTYEWDDSISNSSEEPSDGGRRIRIKSLKRDVVHPLTMDDRINLARRRKRRWGVEEEDALREGVNEFGRGHWKAILDSKRDIFYERTEVDLKDKWRNMTAR